MLTASILLWTVVSTVMLLRQLGNKHSVYKKEHFLVKRIKKVAETIFYAPPLLLATVIGFVLSKKCKK